jgi:hypothetical protein
MSNELEKRIKELKAEAKENEKEWIDLQKRRAENEKRGDEIRQGLHAVYCEWLKTQPAVESWKYWIKRAKEYGLRIYYQDTYVEVVDFGNLDTGEREMYREQYERAEISKVPDEAIILAVVEACANEEWLQ